MISLNPSAQMGKAKDARRQNDILEIRNALDTYYNDYNCYPESLENLTAGPAYYMRKLPKDPDTGNNYYYQVTIPCPQWVVLYSKMSSQKNGSCPLSSLSSCLPTDYTYDYSCTYLGKVDCSYISQNPLPIPAPSNTPTPGPVSPTPSSSPTPTPCSKDYACTGLNLCNNVGKGTGEYCDRNCEGKC